MCRKTSSLSSLCEFVWFRLLTRILFRQAKSSEQIHLMPVVKKWVWSVTIKDSRRLLFEVIEHGIAERRKEWSNKCQWTWFFHYVNYRGDVSHLRICNRSRLPRHFLEAIKGCSSEQQISWSEIGHGQLNLQTMPAACWLPQFMSDAQEELLFALCFVSGSDLGSRIHWNDLKFETETRTWEGWSLRSEIQQGLSIYPKVFQLITPLSSFESQLDQSDDVNRFYSCIYDGTFISSELSVK